MGVASLLLLLAFVVFAFRQGFGVKPDDRRDSGTGGGSGDGIGPLG
jgi:hypothetical protein